MATKKSATKPRSDSGSTAKVEHLDVVIIGAGLSGIGAAHHIKEHCPWASFAILEARGASGGTWDLFRYPGIRSDSDMFTLGYGFRPWDGEKAIADGDTILDYLRDTAKEDGTDKLIRYNHKIVRAEWSTDDARWLVTAERSDPKSGKVDEVTLSAGFVFSCSGYYRYDRGYLPEFEGTDRFEGTIIHPQFWPEDFDYSGKRIVVIGSGATAVTLVPSLADKAGHVTMLQRSPSYVVSIPGKNPIANALRWALPTKVSGPTVRWMNALMTQGIYELSRHQPALMRKVLIGGVKAQVPRGYDVARHFTPHYAPWDERLCAVRDGDMFKAIRKGSASVVTDHIKTFTEKGIMLESGQELEADVIITATGLELLFMGGIEVLVDGEKVDASERLTYKGMMLEGVPNMALAIGYTNASWTLKADLTSEYVTRLLNHLHDNDLRQCTPVNVDGQVSTAPLLGLNSGYITRAAGRLPKQGTAFPWQVYQSYVRDYRALKRSPIVDGAMSFTNPTPSAKEDAA